MRPRTHSTHGWHLPLESLPAHNLRTLYFPIRARARARTHTHTRTHTYTHTHRPPRTISKLESPCACRRRHIYATSLREPATTKSTPTPVSQPPPSHRWEPYSEYEKQRWLNFYCCSRDVFWLGALLPTHRRTCFGWGRWDQTTDARVLVGSVGGPAIKVRGAQYISNPDVAPF